MTTYQPETRYAFSAMDFSSLRPWLQPRRATIERVVITQLPGSGAYAGSLCCGVVVSYRRPKPDIDAIGAMGYFRVGDVAGLLTDFDIKLPESQTTIGEKDFDRLNGHNVTIYELPSKQRIFPSFYGIEPKPRPIQKKKRVKEE
ncbi:MAG: hypothetical protein HYW22_02145 [Candidatus Aenigmarchaeota archaeon]|nr:hypothetical protein [Candidatus Aenigmarchaeota archaeon]